MRFGARSAGLLSVVVLAGCSGGPEATVEPIGKGMNVQFADDAAQAGVIGFVPTPITTTRKGAGITISSENESFSAACTIVGDGFSAAFQTPAVLNLPSYGDVEKPVTLECSDGSVTRMQTYEVKNLSQRQRKGNALAVGVLLSPLAGGIMAGVGSAPKDQDVFGYIPMTISF